MPRRLASLLFAAALAWGQAQMPAPNYCFGFLNAVKDRPTLPKEEAERIQAAHLAHLTALGDKKWLVGAGPILTPGEARGVLIAKCQSLEEANQLASADPAVKAGRLWVQMFRWRGPEGIGDQYWEQRAKDPSARDVMNRRPLVILKRGEKWNGWPAREALQAHFASVTRLLSDGKAVAAGPFVDGGEWIGVFVFAEIPLDEAKKLAAEDPLVVAGQARIEAVEWLVAEGVFPKR